MPISIRLLSIVLLGFGLQAQAAQETLRTFRKIQLTNEFWAEGAGFGDIDRDGRNDVVAGPYWYKGPDFKKRFAFYPATHTFTLKRADGSKQTLPGFEGASGSGSFSDDFYSDNFYAVTHDFNRDGWPDILVAGFPGTDASWYQNPGKRNVHGNTPWNRHAVAEYVDNESLVFMDLFDKGQPVLVCMQDGRAGYFAFDEQDPSKKWTFHSVSEKSDEFQWYTHGLGVGDVNGDGRRDILHSDGWWEQPAAPVDTPVWKHHAYPFHLGPGQIKFTIYTNMESVRRSGLSGDSRAARGLFRETPKINLTADVSADGVPGNVTVYGGSRMFVDDVNADGLPDVITSLTAHGYGLAWWQQMKERYKDGLEGPQSIAFKRRLIIHKEPSENKFGVKFSQMQAVEMADVDGDGLKDIVTGKRYWAHGKDMDPEPNAPAVLYWFKQVRNPDGSAEFVPHLVDDDSGAGTQITVGDVDGDGLPDIMTANKKGAFVFLQELRKVTPEEWRAAQPRVLFPHDK